MSLSRFTVSIDRDLLKRFDDLNASQGCPTRSKAIADLIRESLVRRQWSEGDDVAAAIVLVYDHHGRGLAGRLTHIQHDYHHLIVSSQHVHLDHHNCLEVVVTRGKTAEVEQLANKLRAVKGVKYASIASASTGQGL